MSQLKPLILGLFAALFTLNGFSAAAKDYPVSLFGIKSGGVTLNTQSIQYGIDYISTHGGGRLVFGEGAYLTGCIHIKSGVTIQLDEGAVLLGSVGPFDYDRQNTPFDHNYNSSLALILGLNQHNISITDKGTIDGQGKALAAAVGELLKKGLIQGGNASRPNEDNRPMIINFFGCEQVKIKGITLKNSACWVQCYNQCKNVIIDSVKVESRAFWNNDGIDIVDCNNFKVRNASFNSSDDGICLKSLKSDALNQNIWIENNRITTAASGIKFGTASLGGFKDIHIVNNTVFDTHRSALALEAVDGAIIENIAVDGLQAVNIGNGIFLRAGARKGTRKGQIKNVTIRNVHVEIRAEKELSKMLPAIIIAGLPGQVIADIKFENIDIRFPGGLVKADAKVSVHNMHAIEENAQGYPESSMFGELPAWGMYIRHGQNIHFGNVALSAVKSDFRTAIVLDDVHRCTFKELTVGAFK
ncbi:MAG TPA: glycosyl hydrolase family 28 protein, partial [Arachidicoccus sp.]|nr:glycosyl hydrolase family 28 protein [Arachidicoccus sp.]